MDTKTICEIVAWIKAREDTDAFNNDTFSGPCSPAQTFFEFCANYENIESYPRDQTQQVSNGCRFVHWSGPFRGQPCSAAREPSSGHCVFHNQVVFSERVLGYLREQHNPINQAFTEMGPALLELERQDPSDKENLTDRL